MLYNIITIFIIVNVHVGKFKENLQYCIIVSKSDTFPNIFIWKCDGQTWVKTTTAVTSTIRFRRNAYNTHKKKTKRLIVYFNQFIFFYFIAITILFNEHINGTWFIMRNKKFFYRFIVRM